MFNHPLRQLPKPIDVFMDRIIHITIEIRIAQPNHSSRLEDAPQFPQGFHRLGKMIENGVSQDRVEGPVRERKGIEAGMVELDIADATLLRLSAAHVELAGLNINPHDPPLRDQRRKGDRDPAWTTSTIQQVHGGCEIWHEKRGISSGLPFG